MFTLVTGKRLYYNMLMAEISVTVDETSEYSLMTNIVCREVIIVSTSSVSLPSSAPANQAVAQTTAPAVSTGQQSAQPVTNPPAAVTALAPDGERMSTVYLVPTSPSPQTFSITLAGVPYNLTVIYRNADQGGWVMDIADLNNNDLVCGIPLVVNTNLLAQYAYLGFGGSLTVNSVGGFDDTSVPLYPELGNTAQLYFVTNP